MQNMYQLSLTGNSADKAHLIGRLILTNANRARSFSNRNGDVLLYYRYRSDARNAIRFMAKEFACNQESKDCFRFNNGLTAQIKCVS